MYPPVSFQTKNNQPVILKKLNLNYLDLLTNYLQQLSDETKKRFGPHPYDKESIIDFYNPQNANTGFIAEDIFHKSIIAYLAIKYGYLFHDKERLESYGLQLSDMKCCTFAPSVSDAWQSLGVGKKMLDYILDELRTEGIQYLILWGGVQANNVKAVNLYKKAGFNILGEFEYYGSNYDMMLKIDQ